MLQSFPRGAHEGGDLNADCRWIDLVNATEEEAALVRDRFGITVPTRAALEEIESSSRLRMDGDTLYMSAPLIAGTKSDRWEVAPTGFVLSPNLCLTVRDAQLEAFGTVIAEIGDTPGLDPAEVFIRLLEEVVDRAADHLERASAIVSSASQAVFFDDRQLRHLNSGTAVLRETMLRVGQAADRASRVRYMFLSIDRLAAFVIGRRRPEITGTLRDRLETVRHDISSLDEFEAALGGRIQLLQDAAAGFISIAQNDVVKLLTIVSVVGVPPVLVVGIYGMNFKYMPELSWHYGYPYALVLCAVSAVLPLVWFKIRGWL